MLFSAATLATKIGTGLLTSVFGIFLTAVGYDGSLSVQAASTLDGITAFFKWGPFILMVIMLVIMYFWHLDKELPQIRKDLEARRSAA
jgi:GPH family glycoside/pentoside/hexuronide:cation symporter